MKALVNNAGSSSGMFKIGLRMGSKLVFLLMIIVVFGGCSSPVSRVNQPITAAPVTNQSSTETVKMPILANENSQDEPDIAKNSQNLKSSLAYPLDDFKKRAQLITFGLYVSPKTSPLPKPESFVGYHTGLDLEIIPGEENQDVPVYALTDGVILQAGFVSGYGGVIVESAILDDRKVTILYGHLAESSFLVKKGDEVKKGKAIADLGKAYSPETDGNRKHLHLDIHKGTTIEYKGYVQAKDALEDWLNPSDYLE